jgi:plasmid stabilization system protein ParE
LRVHYTPGALKQLDDILAYISEANPDAAERVAERIDELVRLASVRPGIGRAVPGSKAKAISVRPYPYVIFYRLHTSEQLLEVIRVRHTSRRPLKKP